MNDWKPARRRRWQIAGIVLLVVLGFLGWGAWYKFFRVVPQAQFATEDERFMYGSIGAEDTAGIPYWIMYVLPRVFADKLPGPNGYASFGVNWEMGRELPVGFTKKQIGFDRVANNCAICHTARLRVRPWSNPRFYPTGPNHTFNLEAFFRFLVDCADDPRFNSSTLMAEINLDGNLSWIDQQLYRFVLIPITRQRLLERKPRFEWIYFHGLPQWPDWGRGRDDAMNLTKYFLTAQSKADPTLGPTDMPSVWNLRKYKHQPGFGGVAATDNCTEGTFTRMNFAGDSCDANSVIIDSALGLLGGAPGSNKVFLDEVGWLTNYLEHYQPPKFPFDVDATQAAEGQKVFAANCATCHWSDRLGTPPPAGGYRTGSIVKVEEVGTDIERIKSWNKSAAVRSNEVVKGFGIDRKGLVEADPYGYVAAFLDGIWLRAPYLHNGSVPTLRDLLLPAAQRPTSFYRGYDVYDPIAGGFICTEEQADRLGKEWGYQPHALWDEVKRTGTPYEVQWRSNGNQGHEYGTTLSQTDKDNLLAYLKTL